MRFILDMGISPQIGKWLNSIGHDAIHLNDEHLNTLDDIDIVEKAITEKRIILTTDMDFGHILAFSKSDEVSVIQFRLQDLSPKYVIPKLITVFERFEEHLAVDPVIVTVQDKKIRIKLLPI